MTSRGTMEVTLADARHDAPLARFFQRVWDPTATPERVGEGRSESARTNPVDPGREAPRFIFLSAGEVIGYVSTIPVVAWCDGRAAPAHWIKGLMVLPEHRNGAVGYMLLRETVSRIGDRPCFAMVVEPAALRLFEAMGFRDGGVVPERVRLLRPSRVAAKLAGHASDAPLPARAATAMSLVTRIGLHHPGGWIADLALRGWASTSGWPGRAVAHEIGAPLDADGVDRLWRDVGTEGRWAPAVRSGAYLAARYRDRTRYRTVVVGSESEPEGLAVLRRPADEGVGRLGGVRLATITELLHRRERRDVALALIAACEHMARELRSEALLCAASDPHVHRLLGRRAFLPIPSHMHFLHRGAGGSEGAPLDVSSWLVTRGDSLADEAF